MADINDDKPQGMSDKAWEIYKGRRALAESVKVRVQMLIGLLIFITLLAKIVLYLCPIEEYKFHLLNDIQGKTTLSLVAIGLAYSAGIELAYMLFTPGPDEAIDPLILGLSSAALLIISNTNTVSWEEVLAVAVFSAVIVGLFWVRNRLLNQRSP